MSLEVLDWRRQVFALYREVRGTDDPAESHQLWCAGRQRLVTDHPASPNSTSKLRHAPYEPTMRFVVEVDRSLAPQRLEIPTGVDGDVPFDRIGRVQLDGIGTLDVWWLDSYGGGVWLPLRDPSSDTYGGGRYVLDTVKGADLGSVDERLVVDLNFAYNPSCAYSPDWVCPLAQPGNSVDVEVPVGELLPG